MNIETVLEAQQKINRLMNKYEEITKVLLDCDIDDILMQTQKRQNIIDEISYYDNMIKLECRDQPTALSAYQNKCKRDELSPDLVKIFDLRQELNAIAFRVKDMDQEIRERIIMIRDDLAAKIKEHNSGKDAVASKYAQVGMPSSDKLFIPKNKKMI